MEELTQPSARPVKVDDAKFHARVTEPSEEDAYIGLLIDSAVRAIEMRTRKALMRRTFRISAVDFPEDGEVELPMTPLVSVQTVKYIDANDVLTTWPSTNYVVDTRRQPGRVVLALGSAWPVVKLDTPNAAQIEFTAGYGTEEADALIPASLKAAVLLLSAHIYQNREPSIVTSSALDAVEIPFSLEFLLDTERLLAVV